MSKNNNQLSNSTIQYMEEEVRSHISMRSISMSQLSARSSNQPNNHPKTQDDEVKHEDSSLNFKQEPLAQENLRQSRGYSSQASRSEHNEPFFKEEKQEEQDITLGMATIDLNRYIFNGIVELCRRQKLISEDMAHSFLTNHTMAIDRNFIQLMKAERMHQFNFQKCKINIIDHRRLTELLINNKPERYIPINKPEHPYDYVKQTQQFLREIYALEDYKYKSLLDSLAFDYHQTWWGGPEKISPVVDPPVKFYETEEGQKLREEKENAIRVQSVQEEKQRNKRINMHRATPQDLKDIAKTLASKLYTKTVKIQNQSEAESQSLAPDSSSKQDDSKAKKTKKVKKDKKDKKDKKQKKKKDKKSKKEKIKKENQTAKQEAVSVQPDLLASAVSKKSKNSKKQ